MRMSQSSTSSKKSYLLTMAPLFQRAKWHDLSTGLEPIGLRPQNLHPRAFPEFPALDAYETYRPDSHSWNSRKIVMCCHIIQHVPSSAQFAETRAKVLWSDPWGLLLLLWCLTWWTPCALRFCHATITSTMPCQALITTVAPEILDTKYLGVPRHGRHSTVYIDICAYCLQNLHQYINTCFESV